VELQSEFFHLQLELNKVFYYYYFFKYNYIYFIQCFQNGHIEM
jgi:hypothetical protein